MAFLSRNKKSRVPSDPVTNSVPYDRHPPSLRPQSSASSLPPGGDPSRLSTTSSDGCPPRHGHSSITLPTNLVAELGTIPDDEDAAKERVGKLVMGRDSPEPRPSLNKRSEDEFDSSSVRRGSKGSDFVPSSAQEDGDATMRTSSTKSTGRHRSTLSSSRSKEMTASSRSTKESFFSSHASLPPTRAATPTSPYRPSTMRPSSPNSASLQSRTSRSSQYSIMSSFSSHSNPPPMPGPTDMPRPPDHVIDRLFSTIIQQRDVHSQTGDMASWSAEKKWQLVQNHQIADHKTGDDATKGRGRKDRPQDYLKYFLENSVTVKRVASLNVGLRTYEIPYVLHFCL
jgi:cytokinesis protein